MELENLILNIDKILSLDSDKQKFILNLFDMLVSLHEKWNNSTFPFAVLIFNSLKQDGYLIDKRNKIINEIVKS